MRVAEPSEQERAQIEARLSENGPVEQALQQDQRVAVRTVWRGGHGDGADAGTKAGSVQSGCHWVRAGRLPCLVGEDGGVENRVVDLDTDGAGSLEAASNYITARLTGRTLAEASLAMHAEIKAGKSQLDDASRDLGRTRLGGVERGRRAAPGSDRARGFEPA